MFLHGDKDAKKHRNMAGDVFVAFYEMEMLANYCPSCEVKAKLSADGQVHRVAF